MIKFVAVLFVVTCISLSDACTCIQRTNVQKYCDSDFAGIIIVQTSAFNCGSNKCYGISVLNQVRGPAINPFILQTTTSSAACGVSLTLGYKYFVGSSVTNSAVIRLNLCQLYENWTGLLPAIVEQKTLNYCNIRCLAVAIPIEQPVERASVA